MSKLCDWTYHRNHYAIMMYNSDGIEKVYYSKGIEDIEDINDKLADKLEIDTDNVISIYDNDGILQYAVIHEEDNIKDTINKLEIFTNYKYNSLYLYCGKQSEVTTMNFDYVYNVDNHNSRRFKYNADITVKDAPIEKFKNKEDMNSRTRMTRFDTALMSSFKYDIITVDGIEINIINCMPIDEYIKILGSGNNVYTDNKFKIRVFYPEIREDVLEKYTNVSQFQASIKHSPSLTFQNLVKVTQKNIYSTGLINSLTIKDKLKADVIHFHDCHILEAIVRINYNLKQGTFVDLDKLFKMFTVTADRPFSRIRSEKATNHYIFKDLTDSSSPYFIKKKIIRDWINPNINKSVNTQDMRAVNIATTFDRNIGRGISYKIFNYDSSEGKKYMTLNIYRDGKMELKCSWDEKHGTDPDTNPGGTYDLLLKAIEKVIKIIRELNMIFPVQVSKKYQNQH